MQLDGGAQQVLRAGVHAVISRHSCSERPAEAHVVQSLPCADPAAIIGVRCQVQCREKRQKTRCTQHCIADAHIGRTYGQQLHLLLTAEGTMAATILRESIIHVECGQQIASQHRVQEQAGMPVKGGDKGAGDVCGGECAQPLAHAGGGRCQSFELACQAAGHKPSQPLCLTRI